VGIPRPGHVSSGLQKWPSALRSPQDPSAQGFRSPA
jgi:hypothetical protein